MLFAFYKVFISELSHCRKMFTLDKKEKLGKILHDILDRAGGGANLQWYIYGRCGLVGDRFFSLYKNIYPYAARHLKKNNTLTINN